MHGRREDIVRGLPAVDVVVGVHAALLAAFAAEQFRGAIGQDLVDVHVALRTRAGLPDRQRKLLAMTAEQDFLGGSRDRCGLVFRQKPELAIYARTG